MIPIKRDLSHVFNFFTNGRNFLILARPNLIITSLNKIKHEF